MVYHGVYTLDDILQYATLVETLIVTNIWKEYADSIFRVEMSIAIDNYLKQTNK